MHQSTKVFKDTSTKHVRACACACMRVCACECEAAEQEVVAAEVNKVKRWRDELKCSVKAKSEFIQIMKDK